MRESPGEIPLECRPTRSEPREESFDLPREGREGLGKGISRPGGGGTTCGGGIMRGRKSLITITILMCGGLLCGSAGPPLNLNGWEGGGGEATFEWLGGEDCGATRLMMQAVRPFPLHPHRCGGRFADVLPPRRDPSSPEGVAASCKLLAAANKREGEEEENLGCGRRHHPPSPRGGAPCCCCSCWRRGLGEAKQPSSSARLTLRGGRSAPLIPSVGDGESSLETGRRRAAEHIKEVRCSSRRDDLLAKRLEMTRRLRQEEPPEEAEETTSSLPVGASSGTGWVVEDAQRSACAAVNALVPVPLVSAASRYRAGDIEGIKVVRVGVEVGTRGGMRRLIEEELLGPPAMHLPPGLFRIERPCMQLVVYSPGPHPCSSQVEGHPSQTDVVELSEGDNALSADVVPDGNGGRWEHAADAMHDEDGCG